MLNVITVKVGERYKPEYVTKMRSMLLRHLRIPFEFYCLTEDASGLSDDIGIIEPFPGLEGWWNKMALFSDRMPAGSLLYLDLDQIILGDITGIIEECLKQDFSCYADHIHYQGVKLGTALMTFNSGSFPDIWGKFWVNQEKIQEVYATGGDQVYLGSSIQNPWFMDEHFPGAVQSYKFDILPTGKPPGPEVKLVNFHGRPKPHDLRLVPWVKENWK